jgi:hypothetical protein
MLSQINTNIRAILQDSSKTGTETFIASGSTFTISQPNADTVINILVNGNALESGDFSYDSTSQIVTIESGSVVTGNAVIIIYTYTKYSDTELNDYIRSALVYMDVYTYPIHFDIGSGNIEIYPIPLPKEQSLIAMIVSVLIKPDWSQYRTATVSIVYPRTMEKDIKIERLISKFKMSKMGIVGTINLTGEND